MPVLWAEASTVVVESRFEPSVEDDHPDVAEIHALAEHPPTGQEVGAVALGAILLGHGVLDVLDHDIAGSGQDLDLPGRTAARLGVRGRTGYFQARFPVEVEATWSGS